MAHPQSHCVHVTCSSSVVNTSNPREKTAIIPKAALNKVRAQDFIAVTTHAQTGSPPSSDA